LKQLKPSIKITQKYKANSILRTRIGHHRAIKLFFDEAMIRRRVLSYWTATFGSKYYGNSVTRKHGALIATDDEAYTLQQTREPDDNHSGTHNDRQGDQERRVEGRIAKVSA